MKQSEHDLQASCIKWFDHQFGRRADVLLFAIPNGGHRHPAVASKLKAEGVRAGIPDLCLILKNRVAFIEMKTLSGKLSAKQNEVCEIIENLGHPVYTCRSLLGFINAINNEFEKLKYQ